VEHKLCCSLGWGVVLEQDVQCPQGDGGAWIVVEHPLHQREVGQGQVCGGGRVVQAGEVAGVGLCRGCLVSCYCHPCGSMIGRWWHGEE